MHVRIEVVDAATGHPLPCRLAFRGDGVGPVWGRDAGGRDLAYAGTPRVWCDGYWEGEVPDGVRALIASRPYEYRTRTIDVDTGAPHLRVALEHCCDLPSLGWYCGDAHQHVVHGEALLQVDLPRAAAVARAEGVDWMVFDSRFTSLPDATEPTPEELDALCAAASTGGFMALWADEYPKHDLGHLAAFPQTTGHSFADLAGEGIYHLEDGGRTPYTNFESLRALHRHGSLAVYAHPHRELGGTPGRVGNIARELPLDTLVAPWSVEAVDLISDGVDHPTCWGMWFLWLNAGLRVGLCAFNDACYDRAGEGWREAVAYRRTYAYLGGALDSGALARAVRGGRTFGTTGPLLLFDVDGQWPGCALAADGVRRRARLRAWGVPLYADPAQSGGIQRIVVFRNGEVFRQWEYGARGPGRVEETWELAEEDTAWYVARAEGTLPDQLAVTSPIYFAGAEYREPQPYPVRVRAAVVDGRTGASLSGRMELVEFARDRVDVVEERTFREGVFEGRVPGDLRLRTQVEGYAPRVLSPILDYDPLYRDLLGGIRSADLADPAYYERLRRALDRVELRFELSRE